MTATATSLVISARRLAPRGGTQCKAPEQQVPPLFTIEVTACVHYALCSCLKSLHGECTNAVHASMLAFYAL